MEVINYSHAGPHNLRVSFTRHIESCPRIAAGCYAARLQVRVKVDRGYLGLIMHESDVEVQGRCENNFARRIILRDTRPRQLYKCTIPSREPCFPCDTPAIQAADTTFA